jgi:hypothetical protein
MGGAPCPGEDVLVTEPAEAGPPMIATAPDILRRVREHPRAVDLADALRGIVVMASAVAVALVMRNA